METTMRRIRVRMALVAVVAMITVFMVATQADATGAQVTTGRFDTTQAGMDAGYDINGFAIMVRIPVGSDGETLVRVLVRGLEPNKAYSTHVHNGTCESGGGSHYQEVVGGSVDAVNEIWPTVNTNQRGNGRGAASHGHWARPEAQSIVIHEPGSGVRLACAQLN
ncbi:MAG: hypothetical protein MUQ27_03855 [Acidimicrobiia bacterium]|nr:hypothetical protein [Acidimicrobiia bacterium]